MYHLRLALAFAAMGFIFTSRTWLKWLHTFSPETGLALKHVAILVAIIILNYLDTSIKLEYKTGALGIFLVYLAFMIVFNYQSKWVEDAGSSNVQDQTPDGVLYLRARTNLNLNPDLARIVTFVLVPFVLVITGSHLLRRGQKLNLE
jgi:hypothetical protein